jgi:DNA-binding PadR family transcriptional regulator
MPRWSRSNPLALAVLVCLYEKPMHPYEVAQTLRSRAKEQSVRLNYGSLYAVVESLEKKGFIKATGTVREGKRPQRTIYEITDEGSLEMTDWLTELIGTPNKEYPAFQAGLSFLPALDPDDALAALRHRAEALTMKLVAMRGAMQAAGRRPAPDLRARVRVRGAHPQRRVRLRPGARRGDGERHARGSRVVAPLPDRGLQPRGGALHLRPPQGVNDPGRV